VKAKQKAAAKPKTEGAGAGRIAKAVATSKVAKMPKPKKPDAGKAET
jgi:hypothetical protein